MDNDVNQDDSTPGRQRSTRRRLVTARQFCDRHQAFSSGSLRHLLFHRDTNGLSSAVIKLGRRLLIDEDAFFEWLERQEVGRDESNASKSAPEV